MNVDDRTKGAMSLWEQTRTQRWALIIGLVIGIVVGASVAILFRPLIIAIVVILLALLVVRFVRGMQRRGQGADDGPPVRGMVITGRYSEPATPARADAFDAPLDNTVPADPAGRVSRDLRRGPEYDAEIDAILANIDRQISQEGVRPPGRATRPASRPRSEAAPSSPSSSEVQDADWHDR